MDGSGSREGGAMKPVILRVCVGIVLTASGLILARFVSRKEDTEVTSSASIPESSSSRSGINDGEEEVIESQDHLKQEILSLKTRVEELQRKENLKDEEFSKCIDKLERTSNNVKDIQDEVNDLKSIVEASSDGSSNSKREMVVSLEDYTRVLQKYEDLKKDNENKVTDRRYEENHPDGTSRRKRMMNRLKKCMKVKTHKK